MSSNGFFGHVGHVRANRIRIRVDSSQPREEHTAGHNNLQGDQLNLTQPS